MKWRIGASQALRFGGQSLFFSFFASVGNTGSDNSDPRALYDRGSGRFFLILQEATDTQSFLNLAVSKNSNPATAGAADWYFYRFDVTEASGGLNYGLDYPGLAFDGQAVYVTHNMFILPFTASSAFKNVQIIILKKADIIRGTLTYSIVYTPDGSAFTLQPGSVLGGSSPGNVAFFADIPSSAAIRMWAITDPLGSRTLTSRIMGAPNNGGIITGAPQLGTSLTLDTLSLRAQGNAFWFNGAM